MKPTSSAVSFDIFELGRLLHVCAALCRLTETARSAINYDQKQVATILKNIFHP